MARKTQTIIKETSDVDDTKVVAFRVGQLEHRFDKFEEKLDTLVNNFATVSYVDKEVTALSTRITKLENLNTWITKIILGAVLLSLLSLIGLKIGGL